MTNRFAGFHYIFDAAGTLANDWLIWIIDSLGIQFWVQIFRFGKGPSDQLFRNMELTIGRRTWGFGDTLIVIFLVSAKIHVTGSPG